MSITTVDIPGGSATLRDPRVLTARMRRPIDVISSRLGGRLSAVVGSTAQDKAEAVAQLGLSEDEWDAMWRLNDAIVWALLQSWTIDAPLPATVDAVQDIPNDVYQVLLVECSRVWAAHNGDPSPFEVDGGVEDPASPTGASDGSTGPSEATETPASTG